MGQWNLKALIGLRGHVGGLRWPRLPVPGVLSQFQFQFQFFSSQPEVIGLLVVEVLVNSNLRK